MKIFFRYLAPLLLAVLSFSTHAEGGNVLPQVKLETNYGDIVIELNADKAPNTVANFLSYVNDGFYDGTIFHRVIKDFMVQGGGFTEEFVQKTPKASIKNEANNGLSNVRGSLAMARTGDPHSATAQFFINTVDNNFLDFRGESGAAWGYAVFGQVIEGMDVVDTIRAVSTGNQNGHGDVPNEIVMINSATVVE
ncbi:MAG: peptidylprolyl isomerase [Pseudomonadota bacterium]|nr:peptidylprolyl isomerase [Pseudomonadota bacterium]MDO7710540.1 peptidylprolyl isomerase [Pseudomonadota bacterium]